ncbi:MAG TPA: hypothetical protein VFK03_00215, partial [Candidatus Saccharimonadales bacterium]|nr:hypothetical protein [Candidatus Saccharimonadales bacterium]
DPLMMHHGKEYGDAVDTISRLDDRYRQDLVTDQEIRQYRQAKRLVNFHDGMTPRQFKAWLKAEAKRLQCERRQACYDAGLDYTAMDAPRINWLHFFVKLALAWVAISVVLSMILIIIALMGYVMGGFIPR